MDDVQSRIREEARKVLESGQVSLVLGWGKGSTPFKTTPVFIEKPEDVDRLVWNPACVNNLSVYLPKLTKDKKVAVVAKPCDIRSLITLIQERQVSRDNVYIIGLGCGGVVDVFNLDEQDFHIQDVTGLDWDSGKLKVTAGSSEYVLDCSTCLRDMCLICTKRSPAIFDVELGEAVLPEELCAGQSVLPDIPEERRRYWSEQFSRCIRCYACRQVCPSCYCTACFADRIEPKWTAKKATADEAWMFHATRAMHLAGRCIACGECERACPVDIPIAELQREMNKITSERYKYDAGNSEQDKPLFGQFEDEDFDPAHHSEK